MNTENSAEPSSTEHSTPTRTGTLRLVASNETPAEQRRRAPRRRLVAGYPIERRRTDRRQAKLGLDGLLRTVLADDWKPRVLKAAPVWGKLAAAPQHGADERKRPQP